MLFRSRRRLEQPVEPAVGVQGGPEDCGKGTDPEPCGRSRAASSPAVAPCSASRASAAPPVGTATTRPISTPATAFAPAVSPHRFPSWCYCCAEDARIDVNPPGRAIFLCRKVAAAGSSSAKQPARNEGAGGLLGGSLGLLSSGLFRPLWCVPVGCPAESGRPLAQ